MSRFKNWAQPTFDETGLTKWNWMCQHPENLKMGKNVDVGAFSYLNAEYGIDIEENVQVGSHVSIYSVSTIDDKKGKVTIKKNAKIGTHSVIMPNVTVGENAIIGAFSFVNKNVPDNALVAGIPIKTLQRK